MKPFLIMLVLLIALVASTHAAEMTSDPRAKAGIGSTTASHLAVTLANKRSKQDFGSAPFVAARSTLRFSNGRWHWQAVSGYGHGDLLATVSFSRAGTHPKVQVRTLSLDTLTGDLERGL